MKSRRVLRAGGGGGGHPDMAMPIIPGLGILDGLHLKCNASL